MKNVLSAEGVSAGYGRLQVLFDVSAAFQERQITVVVGPNGSGKSTLLKTVFGLTKLYSGKIFFDGNDISGNPPDKVARLGIAYLPQVNNVFNELTVRENLLMAGYVLNKKDDEQRVTELADSFPTIKEHWSRKAGTLSGGEKQMVAMAMALMRRPRVMLFDEPTGSLAPKIARQVLSRISQIRDEYGVTIVLAEQNAKRALEIGNQAILLVSGQLSYAGEADQLLKQAELARLYLGVGH